MSALTISALSAVGTAGPVPVTIDLCDQEGVHVSGYSPAGVVVERWSGTTDEEGELSVDLTPNDDLTPANTLYLVTVSDRVFIVDKGPGTQALEDALATVPTALGPLIDVVTAAQLAAEASTRAATDAALADDITALSDDLTAEVVARAAAVTAEATARAAGLSAEATARAGADSAEAAIRALADTTEATARATADGLLIPLTQKGAALGVATLDGAGTVPDAQLPATITRDSELASLASDADLAAHEADTTSVHGIPDTSALATTADITAALDSLVDAAPGTLDTLNELAAALGDDEAFATTVTTALAGKEAAGAAAAVQALALLKAANLSDLPSAETARANLVVPRIGGNTGRIQERLWDDVYRTNKGAYENVPSTTITAVTKLYTVPAGFMAWVAFMGFSNPTAGGIALSTFVMPDASTPVASDRMNLTTCAASNSTFLTLDVVLDEGATIWAFAAAPGLNVMPSILLMPKPLKGGTFMTSLIKGVSNVAPTTLYTVSTVGNWAQVASSGQVHNTTGGAIVLTTRLKRAADATAFSIGHQAIPANSQLNYLGGQGPLAATLEDGDTLSVQAAAPGLNLSTFWCERPTVGLP